MLVVSDKDDFIALPMIIRELPSTANGIHNLTDATSVYGYAGPVCTSLHPDDALIQKFRTGLGEFFRSRSCVALFSRLHPMFLQSSLCESIGNVVQLGETVSIDLTLTQTERRSHYRKNVIRSLRRGKGRLEFYVDESWDMLPHFISIYEETMHRVEAGPEYFFDHDYYLALRTIFGPAAYLLFCLEKDTPIGAAIFVGTDEIVQYHFGGSASNRLSVSPMSFLFDGASSLFQGRYKHLHLGGGVGGRPDSLFHFKAGFSLKRHPFFVWRWIVSEPAYEAACLTAGAGFDASGFFPAYRASCVVPPIHPVLMDKRTGV
jgi:hypothetical protein